MLMSTIKQSLFFKSSDARSSSAEENVYTPYPNSWSKPGKDSRTDSSSSMTDTSGRLTIRIARPSFDLLTQSPFNYVRDSFLAVYDALVSIFFPGGLR